MKMRSITTLVIFSLGMVISSAIAEKKIVCYFGSWAVYRPGNGKFDISYIDPSLCTHLIYTFVGIRGNDVRVLDAWQDLPDNWGKNGFGRFNMLRDKNPGLKTLVAIGGWNEGSTKYSQMAKNSATRQQFVANVVKFVKKHGFDGFDIDWEYPAQRGGAPEDVQNYIELLKVMRKAFDENNLIMSAAVAAAKSSASKSYVISEMAKYLDFINVMAYDFHGAWEVRADENAPLHQVIGDPEGWNVESAIKYWLDEGCPKEKLIVGVPSYGRAFTLSDEKLNKIGAPTRGPGRAGPYTREPGMLGYNEICEELKDGKWTVEYDENRQVPYAYKGVQWIGYDNDVSMTKKAELIKNYKLGGAMMWSIETDDFRGICGEKYPLLKILNAVLRDVVDNKPPLFPSTFTTVTRSSHAEYNSSITPPPTTPAVPSDSLSGLCIKPGNMPKPNSCDFITCVKNDAGGYTPYVFSCGSTLCYEKDLDICSWK